MPRREHSRLRPRPRNLALRPRINIPDDNYLKVLGEDEVAWR